MGLTKLWRCTARHRKDEFKTSAHMCRKRDNDMKKYNRILVATHPISLAPGLLCWTGTIVNRLSFVGIRRGGIVSVGCGTRAPLGLGRRRLVSSIIHHGMR